MERQATPLQELDQVEPLQLMLDVEAMENDSVDSLPISIKTAEVTEPRDSDTKYYDVNETQFFDAKMPDEVVIEKEVTEYRFEQHNKVMLSYSWNNQEQMKSIRDALKAAGFDVWMDIDNLAKGSILNNMAEAVEGCDVFVYGVSPAYHKSQACRTEAEYAYTIRKEMIPVKLTENFKPSGWLGILLGNDLYFDISTQEKAVQQLPKLVNAVRVTLNISPSESSSSSDESEPETPVQKTEHYSTNIENNQDDFTDTPNLVSQQVNYDLVRDKLVRLLHGFGMPPEGVLPNWNSGHILSDQAIREFRYLNRAAPGEMFQITWQGTMSEESMRNYFLCLELMGTLSS